MAISAAIQSGACPPRLRPDGRSGRERAHHQRSPKPRRRRGAEEPRGGLRTDGGGGDVEVPSGRCQRRRGHRGSGDPTTRQVSSSRTRTTSNPSARRSIGCCAIPRTRSGLGEMAVVTSSIGFSPTVTCSSTPSCSPTSSARRSAEGAPALLRRRVVGLGSIGAAAMLYWVLLRRPILNWGATGAEATARLPGDELLEDADGVATRAITIDAPAAAVWPWIAQMGPSPRGGAYTYDWIENLLGLDMHSAERVLPEYQHPQVGDTLGYGKNRMRFERVEPSACCDAIRGRQLGLDIRPRRAGRTNPVDQPQPLPTPITDREDRDGSDGAGIARDGTEDAQRYQAARRTPRHRRERADARLSSARCLQPRSGRGDTGRASSTVERKRQS